MTAARRKTRHAALTDLNHVIALALQAIPPIERADAIEEVRADLLALGVSIDELERHGIKLSVPRTGHG